MDERFDTVGPTEGVAGRHLRAATAAALISLLLHFALFYLLARFSFRWVPVKAIPREERPWKPFQITSIEPAKTPPRTQLQPNERPEGPVVAEMVRELRRLRRDPDEAVIQPPSPLEGTLAETTPAPQQPPDLPRRIPFEPRQEILAIQETVAAVELKHLERRRIPQLDRLPAAPAVTFESDWRDRIREPLPEAPPGGTPLPEEKAGPRVYGGRRAAAPVVVEEAAPRERSALFTEKPSEVSRFLPLEKALTVSVRTYRSLLDPRYVYFRLEISRLSDAMLPVLPKDVVLLQDCSNSMSEQRLHFCRAGLKRCLSVLTPEDRFNVFLFREQTVAAFEGWAPGDPDHLRAAAEVIEGMRVGGNTDIFKAIRAVFDLQRQAGRPLLAILISDGMPTTGTTHASDIIGEFTRLNDGSMSVFAVGTAQNANDYLLGLLSYCNRGEATIVTRGRWDIPATLEALLRSVSRPVLVDVGFRFGSGSDAEVYPVLTSNLYLDRPLVLYGRQSRSIRRLTFQAVGRSLDRACDMVFDLDLEKDAAPGDEALRTEWARQKIYHLLGEYARHPDAALREQARETARLYRVPIPYGERP